MRRLVSIDGCDSYSFEWGFGGQLAGSAMAYGEGGDPDPDVDLTYEGAGELSRAGQVEGDITTTRTYAQETVADLEALVLPELMPDPEYFSIPRDNLFPLDADLCDADTLLIRCATSELNITRYGLAHQVATLADVSLFISPGPGLPLLYQNLPRDFRTQGKTALGLLQELLTFAGAPMWFMPGAVFVDGNGLPTGPGLVVDRDASGEASIVTTDHDDSDEPLLSEYLRQCADSDDGQNTWETRESGVFEWTEVSEGRPPGADFQPATMVFHRVEKVGGRVVLERAIKHAPYLAPLSETSSYWAYGWVETVQKEHTYVPCCPDALARSEETVHVRKTLDQAPGFNEGTQGGIGTEALDWWTLAPDTYLHSSRIVEQDWHAEGWLRARSEKSLQFESWEVLGEVGDPLATARPSYDEQSRNELNLPIGGGRWQQRITTSETIPVAVRSRNDDGTSDVIGSTRTKNVNSYTMVTDASPPTVSCSADPCADPEQTCTERETARWSADHAEWQAIYDARMVNDPPRKVVHTRTYVGRRTEFMPGQRLPLGLVARVSWQGNGPRTGSPGESTSVEFWSLEP